MNLVVEEGCRGVGEGWGEGKLKGKPYEGRVHRAVHKNSVPGKYPVTLPRPEGGQRSSRSGQG